jgi:hypothetical protein
MKHPHASLPLIQPIGIQGERASPQAPRCQLSKRLNHDQKKGNEQTQEHHPYLHLTPSGAIFNRIFERMYKEKDIVKHGTSNEYIY